MAWQHEKQKETIAKGPNKDNNKATKKGARNCHSRTRTYEDRVENEKGNIETTHQKGQGKDKNRTNKLQSKADPPPKKIEKQAETGKQKRDKHITQKENKNGQHNKHV